MEYNLENFTALATNTTNFTVVPELFFTDSCSRFQFFLNTVVTGSICLIGLVGNTLSIAVLRRDRLNKVASFLLQAQAVADNCLLIVSFIILTIFVGLGSLPAVNLYLRSAIPFMKKYVNPMGNMTKCFSIWLTVLLAVNRYIAVCRPFSSERLLTLTRAKIQVGVVCVLSIAVNIPRIFQFDVITATDPLTNQTYPRLVMTDLGRNQMLQMIYFTALYTSLILILPLVLLVVLDVLLVRRLRDSVRTMKLNSIGPYDADHERNITAVMLIVVLVVLVCHTPDRIIVVLRYLEKNDDWHCNHVLVYASSISNILVIIRSSVNFFIFFVARRRFRRTLIVKICCRGCGHDFQTTDTYELTGHDRKRSGTNDESVLQHLNNVAHGNGSVHSNGESRSNGVHNNGGCRSNGGNRSNPGVHSNGGGQGNCVHSNGGSHSNSGSRSNGFHHSNSVHGNGCHSNGVLSNGILRSKVANSDEVESGTCTRPERELSYIHRSEEITNKTSDRERCVCSIL